MNNQVFTAVIIVNGKSVSITGTAQMIEAAKKQADQMNKPTVRWTK